MLTTRPLLCTQGKADNGECLLGRCIARCKKAMQPCVWNITGTGIVVPEFEAYENEMHRVLLRKTPLTSLEGKTVSKRFSLAATTSPGPQERCSLWSHKYQTFYNLNYTDIFLFSSTGQLPLRRSRPPSRCQAPDAAQQQQHWRGPDLKPRLHRL